MQCRKFRDETRYIGFVFCADSFLCFVCGLHKERKAPHDSSRRANWAIGVGSHWPCRRGAHFC